MKIEFPFLEDKAEGALYLLSQITKDIYELSILCYLLDRDNLLNRCHPVIGGNYISTASGIYNKDVINLLRTKYGYEFVVDGLLITNDIPDMSDELSIHDTKCVQDLIHTYTDKLQELSYITSTLPESLATTTRDNTLYELNLEHLFTSNNKEEKDSLNLYLYEAAINAWAHYSLCKELKD